MNASDALTGRDRGRIQGVRKATLLIRCHLEIPRGDVPSEWSLVTFSIRFVSACNGTPDSALLGRLRRLRRAVAVTDETYR